MTLQDTLGNLKNLKKAIDKRDQKRTDYDAALGSLRHAREKAGDKAALVIHSTLRVARCVLSSCRRRIKRTKRKQSTMKSTIR